MIPKFRTQFNAEFTQQKYEKMLEKLKEKSGTYPMFRVSESPVFLSADFKHKLEDACKSIISQIKNMSPAELSAAIPEHLIVPNDTEKPHFLTIDFGICKNEQGEIVPQLIELQSFPSLYVFQKELQTAIIDEYPFIAPLKSPYAEAEYYQELKDLIIGNEKPENVILLEIYPDTQKTNIDFYLTEKKLGIKTVCLTKVKKEGRKLFYENQGQLIEIKRIYNRVIFDELERLPDLKMEFDFREELEVKWVTHPNWFFKISKFILPKLESPYVPKSYFLADFPKDEKLGDFVLKPLFSFAGAGVNLTPTPEDLENITDKNNYILQRKVSYAPLFEDPAGDFSKAEIRLLYIWKDNEAEPKLLEHLVRMTKADMVNVDFNKKNAIWIGGTTAFFAQ